MPPDVSVSAPAKIILFGEHAVVYGEPAIAVPVTALRAQVEIHPAEPGAGLVIESPKTRHRFVYHPEDDPEAQSTLEYVARLVLAHFGADPPDVTLHLASRIPIGRGLGSGAAVATAVARGLVGALGETIAPDALNSIIYEVEKRHHGTPSGIDNTVVVYEKPVFFVRGQPIEDVRVRAQFSLLVADTGYSTPTHVPVGDVRRLMERKPERTQQVVARIGEITRAAREALGAGQFKRLGDLMTENHDQLQRLTVSSIELDLLCDSALMAGAHGAKMSGGGRGGNMIALVDNHRVEPVMSALYAAGAERVIKTRVSAH
ncbi:MAG: mevalonate kinase [Anaerolineales bacterium]